MVLHLACRGYGIGLDLPATTNDVAAAIYNLTEGFENEPVQISISGVSSPIPNLYPYIQHADPENTADIQKLNTLAEQIGNMTLEEQRLFSGALELECTGGLDDAIRIAGGLERYEIFPKIVADAELGRFLVDTAFMTGRFSFPEEIKPYLDYAKIGAEQRDTLANLLPGVYEISEKSVPAPWLMDANPQLVTLYANRDHTVYFENHKKPTLTVNKVDSITGSPIKGAKFEVWYGSNSTTTGELNNLGTFFSVENGQFFLDLLRDVWYRVTELEPAPGFTIKEPATQEFYVSGGESKVITFTNVPKNAIFVA